MTDDTLRAAFEAWFETSGMLSQIDKFHREPNAPDEYYDPVTQLTWDGYRAGRAAALEEAAKVCDAEVSEIAKTDDNAAIAASACTERIRALGAK